MAMSRSFGCSSLTRRPSIRISPSVIVSRPAMVFKRVDLPQPDGPTRTRKPPCSTARSIPCSTSAAPKRLTTRSISRNAIAATQPLTAPAIRPRTKYRPETM
jgi:hypothetical protein